MINCVFFFFFLGGEFGTTYKSIRMCQYQLNTGNVVSYIRPLISLHAGWPIWKLSLKGRLEGLSSHNRIYYTHKSQLFTQHLMWYGLSRLPFGSESQFSKMNRIMSQSLKASKCSLSPCRDCYVLFVWVYGKMVSFSENFYQIPFIFLYHLQICTRNLIIK